MKIKSKIDVITNSSSEVYVFKLDDPYYEIFKSMVPEFDFDEIKDEEDLKNFLLGSDYYEGWMFGSDSYSVQNHVGPDIRPICDILSDYDFQNYCRESGKSKDDIWSFVKDSYKCCIGYAYGSFENDCCGTTFMNKVWEALGKIKVMKIKAYLSQFNEGDILVAPFNAYGCSEKEVKLKFLNKDKCEFDLLTKIENLAPDVKWIYFVDILKAKKYEG